MQPNETFSMDTGQTPGVNRRDFLRTAATGVAALAVASAFGPMQALAAGSKLELPPLPYAMDALEPSISKRTLEFHYGKHHAGYVKKANAALKGAGMGNLSIEEIIFRTSGDPAKTNIFNNVAQAFNHSFYWNSMKPGGGGRSDGVLAREINDAFGSYEGFVKAFSKAATGQFGSGWAWLVRYNGKLRVVKTANADTPVAHGMTPVLTIDVWEHAYYLDYQNRRGDYVAAWLDNLVNWDFAEYSLT